MPSSRNGRGDLRLEQSRSYPLSGPCCRFPVSRSGGGKGRGPWADGSGKTSLLEYCRVSIGRTAAGCTSITMTWGICSRATQGSRPLPSKRSGFLVARSGTTSGLGYRR